MRVPGFSVFACFVDNSSSIGVAGHWPNYGCAVNTTWQSTMEDRLRMSFVDLLTVSRGTRSSINYTDHRRLFRLFSRSFAVTTTQRTAFVMAYGEGFTAAADRG